MKTINLKDIKEIDGQSCKIVYNTGCGCFEVELDNADSRQSLNYIIGKICKTDTETFTIGPADELLFDDGRVAEVLTPVNAPDERYALEIDGEEYPALLLMKSTCKITK